MFHEENYIILIDADLVKKDMNTRLAEEVENLTCQKKTQAGKEKTGQGNENVPRRRESKVR